MTGAACPSCGAPPSSAPGTGTGPGGTVTNADILAALEQLIAYNAPLRVNFYQNWSGSTLPNPVPSGAVTIPIQLSQFIPVGCRSVLLRNLSPTKPITYGYIDSQSLPAPSYQTLPASQAIAIDVDPRKLSVVLDNTNADAGFEVTFFT